VIKHSDRERVVLDSCLNEVGRKDRFKGGV
jgi:hypothetical protein